MSEFIPRRSFLKKTALAAGATIAAPYILPSGSLFAATGERMVNHVVLCLFAGGIRNNESIWQERGNLLPNLLGGTPSVDPMIAGGTELLPVINQKGLLSSGTLFTKFLYNKGPIGHFNAHVAALTGKYFEQSLYPAMIPAQPTVFEYYHKYQSYQNKKAWWIANRLGYYPTLSYSRHPEFGINYGAELAAVSDAFLSSVSPIESNHAAEIGMNSDLLNVFKAREVIREYQPELLALNLQGADIAHSNYTAYCNNLRKADYALGLLWEEIQNTPGMTNDTILMVVSEHGRNQRCNELADENGLYGIDHSDELARETFCLIAGPEGKVRHREIVSKTEAESIDIVPTIACILGFDQDVPKGMLQSRVLEEAFV